MSIQTADVIIRQLELCRLAVTDSAAVLTDAATEPALLACVLDALSRLGLRFDCVPVDWLAPGELVPSLQAVEGLGADIVLDLSGQYSPDVADLVSFGSRLLEVIAHSTADLRGVVPHSELERRVRRGQELLRAGQQLHLSGTKGSDLTICLTEAQQWAQSGLVVASGQRAQWPRGIIGSTSQTGTAKGKVVMSPGDVWLPMGWYVRSTVVLSFEKGKLVGINGPQSEVEAIKAQLSSIGDPDAYHFGAVEIGLLWIDQPSPNSLFEPGLASSPTLCDRYGHVSFVCGPVAAAELSESSKMAGKTANIPVGKTVSIGGCLRNASVTVDDVVVVRAGHPQGELAPDVYEQAAHRWALWGALS